MSYHWADCTDGCSWAAHRQHMHEHQERVVTVQGPPLSAGPDPYPGPSRVLTAAEFADQVAETREAAAWQRAKQKALARLREAMTTTDDGPGVQAAIPVTGDWREAYAAVMGEPLGLAGRELDKAAPVGAAQPGCCKECLTGPVYENGLCLYCWAKADLAAASSGDEIAGELPDKSLAWLTAGHVKHCMCHACQLRQARKQVFILGLLVSLLVVWCVTGLVMGVSV